MAKGFKQGAGGGAPLNFKVVRYASEADLPENAKDNTIAVFTNVDLTGWRFSPTQPENMAQGEVWFETGIASDNAFNALKINSIVVHPMSAKQFVDGALVDVTAKIFQNGEWLEWISDIILDLDPSKWTTWPKATYGKTFNYANGVLTVSSSQGSSSVFQSAGKYYNEPFDLTNYDTMVVDGSWSRSGNGNFKMCFTNNLSITDGTQGQAYIVLENASGEKSIDVSALSGEYYFGIMLTVGSSANVTGNIKNITLKKKEVA